MIVVSVPHLKASAPAPLLSVADTFDRADNPTSLATASDGGTWTVSGGESPDFAVFGTVANVARMTEGYGPSTRARRSLGKAQQDITVSTNRGGNAGYGYIHFAYDPALNSGYALRYDGSLLGFVKIVGLVETFLFELPNTTQLANVFRVTYNGAGLMQAYVAGVSVGSHTDATALAGQWVGFGAQQGFVAHGDTWNDFSAV